jgi:hypothetical protein
MKAKPNHYEATTAMKGDTALVPQIENVHGSGTSAAYIFRFWDIAASP